MTRDPVRRRWIVWGLAAYALVVVAVLVLPVSYGAVVRRIGAFLADLGLRGFGTGWVEFVANIAMFAPLGLLLTLALGRRWLGVLIAVALSVAAELAQVVLPSRQPSMRDVLANALGALVGAMLAWIVLRRRLRAQRRHAAREGGMAGEPVNPAPPTATTRAR